ncbi:hypothetical protein ACM5Q9_03305 [Advenella sp. RU8]
MMAFYGADDGGAVFDRVERSRPVHRLRILRGFGIPHGLRRVSQ